MAKEISKTECLECASKTPLFKGIETAVIESYLSKPGVCMEIYQKGCLLYASKGKTRYIGFLVSGSAKVTKNDGTGKMLMSILHAGDVFGAATLLCERDCIVASIYAICATQAILIPETTWLEIMQQDFRMAKNYMEYLTARIRFLSSRIDGFVKPTIEDRVLSFLRSRTGSDGIYRPETSLRAVGDALCISRTTLYRTFDALTENGKIEKIGRNIRLLQEE